MLDESVVYFYGDPITFDEGKIQLVLKAEDTVSQKFHFYT
jgi:hypothetical protein